MAQGSHLHRFQIALSDADRNVYEALDLRLARHPSETAAFLLTRAIAACMVWEEGIELSKGLSSTDEPAMRVLEPDGRVKAWIEIGLPAADRVHRASKIADRVLIFPHRGFDAWRAELALARIHKADEIRIVPLDGALIAALEARLDRNEKWDVSIHEQHIYIERAGEHFDAEITKLPLRA